MLTLHSEAVGYESSSSLYFVPHISSVPPVPIDEFLAAAGPILDVRSPGEFEQGHIPGAISFPLFSNEERAKVGTCYKQQSREQAIELGLDLVGPKLGEFGSTGKSNCARQSCSTSLLARGNAQRCDRLAPRSSRLQYRHT